MPTTTQVRIDTSDTYRVTNIGDDTVTFVYNKSKKIINPGETQFLNFDVVKLYFGDPRSVVGSTRKFQDSRGTGDIPDRRAEIDRLATLYGIYADKHRLPTVVPCCKVETASGYELILPAFDPTGENMPKEETQIDVNSITDVQTVLTGLRQQQQLLERRLDLMKNNTPNTTTDVLVDGEDEEFATV